MQKNQGGSVVSFLVVGVVFVAIVTGAVYTLQHRTADNGVNKKPSSSLSPSISSTTDGTASVAPSPSPSGTPAPATSTPRPPQAGQNGGPTAPAPGSGSPSANMPVTGPSDMMPGGTVIAVLIGTIVAFAQSVKARRRLSV